jgi:hypothetical protein
VRPRDNEAQKKFKSFPFSSTKKRRDSEEKFWLTPLVKSVEKRASEKNLEKCGSPLKHCKLQRSGRKA